MSDTKSLTALIDAEMALNDLRSDVRRSREIEAAVAELLTTKAQLDATIIETVGVGNAIEVDGEVTRVKQSTGPLTLSLRDLTAAREAGTVSRGAFNNCTTRVVDMQYVRSMHDLGRLNPSVEELLGKSKDSAAYVTHL